MRHNRRYLSELFKDYLGLAPWPHFRVSRLDLSLDHLEMATEITVEEAFVALGIAAHSSSDDDSDGQ